MSEEEDNQRQLRAMMLNQLSEGTAATAKTCGVDAHWTMAIDRYNKTVPLERRLEYLEGGINQTNLVRLVNAMDWISENCRDLMVYGAEVFVTAEGKGTVGMKCLFDYAIRGEIR